jgi:hypothetical protein
MNHPSSTLHSLIHTLTADERSHVEEFIKLRKHNGNKSILLDMFAAIAQQTIYNQTNLRHSLKHSLSSNSFKTCKSELKEIILDSLCAQRKTVSQSMDYRRMLDHAQVLISKELYAEALSYLKHLKKSITPDFYQRNTLIVIEALELETIAVQ